MHLACDNTGKPYVVHRGEEIGPMADQIRFFAGAAHNLEGQPRQLTAPADELHRIEPIASLHHADTGPTEDRAGAQSRQ